MTHDHMKEIEARAELQDLRDQKGVDQTREEWLMRAARMILDHVATLGYRPTGTVKTSLGVLTAGRKAIPLGVCYHSVASEGAYREIFINPGITDPRKLLGILTHEIGHAVLDDDVGHRAPFRAFCSAVGFDFRETGKAANAHDGNQWWEWIEPIAERLGPMPHKKLNLDRPQGEKKKQTTRMLLLECPCCGIKVRAARSVMAEIVENTGRCEAQCMNPACSTPIDFTDVYNEVDGAE